MVYEQRLIKRFNFIERFKIKGLWSNPEVNKDVIVASLGSSLSDYLSRFGCKISDSVTVGEYGFYSDAFRGLIIQSDSEWFRIDYHPNGSVYVGTNK